MPEFLRASWEAGVLSSGVDQASGMLGTQTRDAIGYGVSIVRASRGVLDSVTISRANHHQGYPWQTGDAK